MGLGAGEDKVTVEQLDLGMDKAVAKAADQVEQIALEPAKEETTISHGSNYNNKIFHW